MPKKASKSFEVAITELESIIRELEGGEVTLDDSIKKYKEGMELAVYCSEVLKKAEQEIYVYGDKGFEKVNEGEV